MKVGVVGLGTMGAPMARHLITAGHDVTVWNRTREREVPLAELGASRAGSAAEAAGGAAAVLTCVSDDPDLAAVVLGPDGVASGLAAGAVLIDCSTASPSLARELAKQLAEGGRLFVDAPVSGGSEGAERGTLTVFVGGTGEAVALAMPVLRTFGARITHLGPAGSGQAAKAVNQVVLAGVYAGVAEGVVLAERFGLPADALQEALAAGAADSWVLRTGPRTWSPGRIRSGSARRCTSRTSGSRCGRLRRSGCRWTSGGSSPRSRHVWWQPVSATKTCRTWRGTRAARTLGSLGRAGPPRATESESGCCRSLATTI
jgi:3-hydroxyisobutyrate dehydrogenase-like beta-hydroxyacid dehydrogenase